MGKMCTRNKCLRAATAHSSNAPLHERPTAPVGFEPLARHRRWWSRGTLGPFAGPRPDRLFARRGPADKRRHRRRAPPPLPNTVPGRSGENRRHSSRRFPAPSKHGEAFRHFATDRFGSPVTVSKLKRKLVERGLLKKSSKLELADG
jgi:hypothetical protein